MYFIVIALVWSCLMSHGIVNAQNQGTCMKPSANFGTVFCSNNGDTIMNGARCSLRCSQGYVLVDPNRNTITCRNGQFDGQLTQCRDNPSGTGSVAGCQPNSISVANGILDCNNQQLVPQDGTCTVVCNQGYRVDTPTNPSDPRRARVTCSGRWGFINVPTCRRIQGCNRPTVFNAQVQCNSNGGLVPVASTCNVFCNSGYVISGSSLITCARGPSGYSFGTTPRCNAQASGCGLPDVPHGRVQCPGFTQNVPSNVYCSVVCEPGYELSDPSHVSITCMNGRISPGTPVCVDKCPDGHYFYGRFWFQTCRMCRPGSYRAKNSNWRFCSRCRCGQSTFKYGAVTEAECTSLVGGAGGSGGGGWLGGFGGWLGFGDNDFNNCQPWD